MIIMLIVFTISGCGVVDREVARLTGTGLGQCWHNVMYIQFTSGASVAYNSDGSIMTCSDYEKYK